MSESLGHTDTEPGDMYVKAPDTVVVAAAADCVIFAGCAAVVADYYAEAVDNAVAEHEVCAGMVAECEVFADTAVGNEAESCSLIWIVPLNKWVPVSH